jgi:hypothetical protein
VYTILACFYSNYRLACKRSGRVKRWNRERVYFILSTNKLVRKVKSEEEEQREGPFYPVLGLAGEKGGRFNRN